MEETIWKQLNSTLFRSKEYTNITNTKSLTEMYVYIRSVDKPIVGMKNNVKNK